jgi:DNA-binding CsgD family transcriptional regulator
MQQSQDIFGQVQTCVRALSRSPGAGRNRVHEVELPGGRAFFAGAESARAGQMLVCCVFARPAELLGTAALPPGVLGLTKTQERVAQLLTRGLTNAEIAEELGMSPYTVRRHTEHIFLRLGVRRRRDVAGAIQNRLTKAMRDRLERPANRDAA